MSYRHAWGLVKEAENLIGGPLLETRKGGKAGGGGARLTRAGEEFLKNFSRAKERVSKVSLDEFGWEDLFEVQCEEQD